MSYLPCEPSDVPVPAGDAGAGSDAVPNRLEHVPMTPQQFRLWRKSLGLKQKEAAELLGLKKRMIQYYEKGEREGKPISIPKYIRLACYAVSQGVYDFDGESTSDTN